MILPALVLLACTGTEPEQVTGPVDDTSQPGDSGEPDTRTAMPPQLGEKICRNRPSENQYSLIH